MEVSETNSHDGLNDVSLQQETSCTVESKALEENGGDLAFPSTFSPETQVGSQLAALGKNFTISYSWVKKYTPCSFGVK